MTGILCSLSMIGAPTSATSGGSGGGGGGYTVTLTSNSASGSSTSSNITTGSVTASASGGTSPYTFKWLRRSGDASTSATSANSATTSFMRTGCIGGTSYQSTWHCKVTDHSGTIVYSGNVIVTITDTATSSGGGGTGGGTFIGVADDSVSQIGVSASETITWAVNSNGTYGKASESTWNSSTTAGSGYEARATLISSSATISGTFGTWLSLSTSRSWSMTDSTQDNNAETGSFTLEMRAAGTTTVLSSATISLTANALNTL